MIILGRSVEGFSRSILATSITVRNYMYLRRCWSLGGNDM
jgi:hypothetical protein